MVRTLKFEWVKERKVIFAEKLAKTDIHDCYHVFLGTCVLFSWFHVTLDSSNKEFWKPCRCLTGYRESLEERKYVRVISKLNLGPFNTKKHC